MINKDVKDYISYYHDYGFYIPTRTIEIGAIDKASVDQIIRNLSILESIDKKRVITFEIDSTGGDLYQTRRLYNVIRRSKCPLSAIVSGEASSCGSLLLQAFKTRTMTSDSYLMLHIGTTSASEDEHPKTADQWKKKNKEIEDWMIDIYWNRMRQKKKMVKKTFRNKLDFDWIFNSEEALEWGLIDEVI